MGQRGKAAIAIDLHGARSGLDDFGVRMAVDLAAFQRRHVAWNTEQAVRGAAIGFSTGDCLSHGSGVFLIAAVGSKGV